MSGVQLEKVVKKPYSRNIVGLAGVDLTVTRANFLSCSARPVRVNSQLLRLIAGLERPRPRDHLCRRAAVT